ncbi:MAG: recombinase family protein [Xanthobacteraceae bacterium]
MAKFGYARVSTGDQNLSTQIERLKAAGCEPVRSEKVSGTSVNGREELKNLLSFIRSGDTLVVTKLDRLARSMADLQDIVRGLKAKGADLAILDQNIDTATASGKAFLNMLGTFAEFENDLRRERQLEGIRKAKAEGKYKGRPATLDVAEIARLREHMSPTVIADQLGIARSSVYRALQMRPFPKGNIIPVNIERRRLVEAGTEPNLPKSNGNGTGNGDA